VTRQRVALVSPDQAIPRPLSISFLASNNGSRPSKNLAVGIRTVKAQSLNRALTALDIRHFYPRRHHVRDNNMRSRSTSTDAADAKRALWHVTRSMDLMKTKPGAT
jgi:hypothetical protein